MLAREEDAVSSEQNVKIGLQDDVEAAVASSFFFFFLFVMTLIRILSIPKELGAHRKNPGQPASLVPIMSHTDPVLTYQVPLATRVTLSNHQDMFM